LPSHESEESKDRRWKKERRHLGKKGPRINGGGQAITSKWTRSDEKKNMNRGKKERELAGFAGISVWNGLILQPCVFWVFKGKRGYHRRKNIKEGRGISWKAGQVNRKHQGPTPGKGGGV